MILSLFEVLQPMSDVFISYSRLDKAFVGRLREAFHHHAQDVWIDWEDIPPSQSWWHEIQKGILRANNVLVILSPHSMASPICHLEIEFARQHGKRIIPVLHHDYQRQSALDAIQARLAHPEQEATRSIWGQRQAEAVYDGNDSELKHINFFFFSEQDHFQTKFEALLGIIHTDYAHKEQHTTLELRAAEWQRRAHDASFLLLDTELAQAEAWLNASTDKQPAPTALHRAYIQASHKRTRQLRAIRHASFIGTSVAVLALVFAVLASVLGVQASRDALSANTQAAQALQTRNAVLPTLTQAYAQALSAEQRAEQAQQQAALAIVTVTQAAIVQEIVQTFSNVMLLNDEKVSLQMATMNELVARYPQQAQAYHVRGLVYNEQANYAAAIADFSQAIQLDPSNSTLYHNRGIAYFEQANYAAAIADFNQAIQLNPSYSQAFNNRGLSHYHQGDDAAAIADFDQAIFYDPSNNDAYNNRGIVHMRQADYPSAIADFSQAIRYNPDFVESYDNRGRAHLALGATQAALEDFTQAIRLNPQYPAAFYNRATLHYNNGEFASAVRDYSAAIRLDPQFAGNYYSRGLAYTALNQLDQALADYEMAIQLAPDYSDAYMDRANILSEQGRLEDALASYTQAIRLNPRSAPAYFNRAILQYVQMGDVDAALADYSAAILHNPSFVEAYLGRADILLEQGYFVDARADYDAAIALAPDWALAYAKRGLVYYFQFLSGIEEQDSLALAYADWQTAQSLGYDMPPLLLETFAEVESLLKTTSTANP